MISRVCDDTTKGIQIAGMTSRARSNLLEYSKYRSALDAFALTTKCKRIMSECICTMLQASESENVVI